MGCADQTKQGDDPGLNRQARNHLTETRLAGLQEEHAFRLKQESGFSLRERNENDTKNHVAQQ